MQGSTSLTVSVLVRPAAVAVVAYVAERVVAVAKGRGRGGACCTRYQPALHAASFPTTNTRSSDLQHSAAQSAAGLDVHKPACSEVHSPQVDQVGDAV